MRCPFSQGKRQKTAREREMHRLIREKCKPFWGDEGSYFIGGHSFREMRTKSGPSMVFREGKSPGVKSESGVGGRRGGGGGGRGLAPPTWGGQGPCLDPEGLPSLAPTEGEPTGPRAAPPHPHSPVQAAGCLAGCAACLRKLCPHLTSLCSQPHWAGGGSPRPPRCGSSSHSPTKKHCCFKRWF